MIIRAGYTIAFDCFQDVPMVVLLSVHPSRQNDLRSEHKIEVSPRVIARDGLDPFGNTWTRFVAPAGRVEICNDFLIEDSGLPDESAPEARQWDVNELPDEVLPFLHGSRYCDTQKLTSLAWSIFGPIAAGWRRVQAICDYVHERIQFGYHHARCDRMASEGHEERVGVCRDFAHLAVTLCRCMNIPARYCTGYLGDIGVPKDPAPMDFSAWFEVFLDGRWFTFDARHNVPRIGRIVIARGRDAADVAISTQFGNAVLARFDVVTEEVGDEGGLQPSGVKQLKYALAAGTQAVSFGSNCNESARCALWMEVDRADTKAHYVSQRPRFTGQGSGAGFAPTTQVVSS